MPIPISDYVSITSGVGAGNNVSTRNLGALIITNNDLCPTGTVLSFTSAAAVGTYFGTSSEEYQRAVFYFSYISKNITAPSQLSFYFWNNDAATGSTIFGVQAAYAVGTFTPVTTGDFTLTLGGHTSHLTNLNFGSDSTLAQVASTLQTAIRAVSAGGAAWTAATVAYVASPTQGGAPQFTLVSGATGTDIITVAAGTVSDVASLLGWLTGAILSNGDNAETTAQNLTNLLNITNNFGSFCYTYELNMTLTNIEAAANWNNSTNPNIQFMFSIPVTAANASAWNAALVGVGGCTATLQYPGGADPTGAYHEMMPMMILAATNYSARNSVFNYMFNEFNATPTVTDQTHQLLYDGLLVNYYGQTETAGQTLNFYQRGVMFGIATNPSDQNVYANEIWFKDAIGAAIMTLLLSLAQVPANSTGQAQILGVIQSIIGAALFNGTISAGKTLTIAQQLYITNATGSPTAWRQVQSQGYWVNVIIQPYVTDGITEYEALYTLIYSKDDVVRLVLGTDILI